MGRINNARKKVWSYVLDHICCGCMKRKMEEDVATDEEDYGDVFVTRVYVSHSAENVAKQHDINHQKRCQSSIEVDQFVDMTAHKTKKRRSWLRNIFKDRAKTEEELKEKKKDILKSIRVEDDVEYSMFAESEDIPVDGPSDHFVGEGGEFWDIDMFIGF